MDLLRDTFGPFMTAGFVLLLILLRLDAERFGAAEYDEVDRRGEAPSIRRRLAWYVLGFGLIVAAGLAHPNASRDLYLTLGDRGRTIVYGFLYGAIGTAQAIAFAWLRYRRLRLPGIAAYPGSLINDIATAFIDEAAFRGLLLGFIVLTGVNASTANVIQALVYALATRLGAPGRDRYMLVLALLIGLAGGWLTLATGGIGAAFLGHAVTRIAVFLTTGHAGQVALRGRETEDIERRRRTPDGWRMIGDRRREPSGPDR
jgi:hypothetical protein